MAMLGEGQVSDSVPSSDVGSTSESCRVCGFPSDELRTTDVTVALSSLPRWWRQVLHSGAGPEVLRRRVPGDCRSPLEHGAYVCGELRMKAGQLARLRDEDDALLDRVVIDAPRAADNDEDPDVVLAEIGQHAIHFVKLVVDMPPTIWWRTGRRHRRPVTGLELVREAVHEGVHHLRAARAVLVSADAAPAHDAVDEDIWGQ
jgi:hypothetical protein